MFSRLLLSALLPFTSLASAALSGSEPTLAPRLPDDIEAEAEYESQKNQLTVDPQGYWHLGDDGVLRSLDSRHNVLGWAAAPPSAIAREIEHWPHREDRAHLRRVYQGVDGRDVERPGKLEDRQVHQIARRNFGGPGEDEPPAAGGPGRSSGVSSENPAAVVVRNGLGKRIPAFCASINERCRMSEGCATPRACVCQYIDNHVKPTCQRGPDIDD